MELDDAIAILFGTAPAHARTQAYGKVSSFLQDCARRQGARDPEEVAQQVLSRLLTRARGDEVPWNNPSAGKAYLAKCAERAAIDEHRRERRHSLLPDELIAESAAPPLIGDDRALLEKVAAIARSRRAPRYRSQFDATWSQICALVFDKSELHELLVLQGTLAPNHSQAELVQVRNRAYKNHERVRDELLATVDEMRGAGQLSADDSELALTYLRVLVRCQRSEPRSVSQARKDGT